MKLIAALAMALIMAIVFTGGETAQASCSYESDCVVKNPPRLSAKKKTGRLCQTICLEAADWEYARNSHAGCWWADTSEGYRTQKFFGQCGTLCRPSNCNDWGYTGQATGRQYTFFPGGPAGQACR